MLQTRQSFHQLALSHSNPLLEMPLLDLDSRFAYLPLFQYFDLRRPQDLTCDSFGQMSNTITTISRNPPNLPTSPSSNQINQQQQPPSYKIIIFDPPFFYIPLEILHAAVVHISNLSLRSSSSPPKLLIGFLKREEQALLSTFREFDLKPTNFELEYSHVKPNKWRNYCLYSNVDLKGVKRVLKGGRRKSS